MAKSSGVLSPTALARLNGLVTRSERKSGVRLEIGFVRGDGISVPPLVGLFRGERGHQVGRGGEVRLKLWLSLALLAAKSPYVIRQPMPTRVWAETLGLPDPDGRGSRRIADAIGWLDDHGFVTATRRQGRAAGLEVIYPNPAKAHRASKGRWVVAPVQLWSQGWIVTLSGAALVVLLDMIELTNAGKVAAPRSLDLARKLEYGLSDDTWGRATQELEDVGLLTVGSWVTEENFVRRRRNTYVFENQVLDHGPAAAFPLNP